MKGGACSQQFSVYKAIPVSIHEWTMRAYRYNVTSGSFSSRARAADILLMALFWRDFQIFFKFRREISPTRSDRTPTLSAARLDERTLQVDQ